MSRTDERRPSPQQDGVVKAAAGGRAADPPRPSIVSGPARVVRGSIGILGGTFDPIHVGHLAIAEEARDALGLEQVLFVPAAAPPHKRGRRITAGHHRLAMVELAIDDNPAFHASRIELDRDGPSYTADTLEALAADLRATGREPDLTFVLSGEALRELPTWHEPTRVLDGCRLAVVPRAGHRTPDRTWLERTFPGRAHRVAYLGGPRLAVSGSQIRARVSAGRSIRYLVPRAVERYIADHGLYADDSRRNNRP